jgi:hypothetical protein
MIKARFLFSDELNLFLKSVWDRHCNFGLHNDLSKLENNSDKTNRIENVKLRAEDLKWFFSQFENLHLHFGEIRPVAVEKQTTVFQALARATAKAAPTSTIPAISSPDKTSSNTAQP